MVGLLHISTVGGKQILWDYVNWRKTSWKPIDPIGSTPHWNSRKKLYHVLTQPAFSAACKAIAPIAIAMMSKEDFNYLLGRLTGKKNKDTRDGLRETRKENKDKIPKDIAAAISSMVPEPEFKTGSKTKIAALSKYTPAGRQLMIDFVNCKESGFDPAVKPGNVDHYKSRPEYQDGITKDAFTSQAKKIAKDVLALVPCDREMLLIVEKAKMRAGEKSKEVQPMPTKQKIPKMHKKNEQAYQKQEQQKKKKEKSMNKHLSQTKDLDTLLETYNTSIEEIDQLVMEALADLKI